MNTFTHHHQVGRLAAVGAVILLAIIGSAMARIAQDKANLPKSSLSADIIGTWKGKLGDDAVTLTFNQDKSFSLKESESAPIISDRYAVLDAETVELQAPNHLCMRVKIKVSGDTMHLTDQAGHSFDLKRVK